MAHVGQRYVIHRYYDFNEGELFLSSVFIDRLDDNLRMPYMITLGTKIILRESSANSNTEAIWSI